MVFLLITELGAAVATGAVLATIFMVIVFWRWPAKSRSLVNDAHRVSDPDPSLSLISTRADMEVPAIFLSHSGKQKPFVEHLYNALENANHSPFFDQHSLPKGSPFPSHIIRAARGCKLGVVVLSDDFLTSKWPMLELEMLVLQRGHDASVLPIFYKLRPEDLKSTTNLSKWRRVWKKKAGADAVKWERAVKALSSFNGEVFVQGTSEAAFIKKVVHRICTCVPNHAPYDLSSVQGHQRLAKEIASQFEDADARRFVKARMIGLHGVGGLGKTTMCKIMVNFYNVEYPGRSCLIEFPTDGDDKKIVQECKKALKKLTNLSNDHLLNEADSFDQVVQLMRQHVRRYDVFLAIDNVWESSLEAAQRILGVSFSANSKILLTSRSEQVLKDLLIIRGHNNNTSVGPLAAPELEEAFQIFQEAFKLGDLNSLVNRNQIDSVLKRCRFSGKYHVLALKALGQYVKSVCALGDLGKIEHHLSLILEEISNADLENLEDVIRLNYENLPEYKKHMFLDIAVLLRQDIPVFSRQHVLDACTYATAQQWLSCVYKEFPKTKTTRLIYELALDGLIQIEEDKFSEKMIRVHDLFLDLAQREAASGPRFFTNRSNRLVEEIEWERLERVMLRGDENTHFIEKLQQQECRKLRVLCAVDINFRSKIHLDFMPSLCVLILCSVTVENWSDVTSGLAIVEQPLEDIPSMPSSEELTINYSIVEGVDASRVLNLNGLVQLQMLQVERCSFVERIAGLNALKNLQRLYVDDCPLLENLDDLSGLIRLEALDVKECESLKKMPDLSGMTCLERMELSRNESLEEVGCLSSALKDVCVKYCRVLKKMPDMSGLTCLERLVLFDNESMEEVRGEYLSSSLKHLDINRCGSLRSFPSLDECIHMQTLTASARHIKIVSVLEKLTKLQMLGVIHMNSKWLFSEHQWKRLILLQRLSIGRSHLMTMDVGCLSPLTNLKGLEVGGCLALEQIRDLSALHNLEVLDVYHCPRLKKLGGFMGIATHLKRLWLSDCESLEATTLPDVSLISHINYVSISGCGELKDFQQRS